MSRKSSSTGGLSSIITLVTILGVLASSVGYADPEGAKALLTDEGYTDVVITGRQWSGCDNNLYRTKFTAKNSRGIKVHGLVCKGIMDAAYIKRT